MTSKKAARRHDEATKLDVARMFKKGQTTDEIAEALYTNRHEVMDLLRLAFMEDLVVIPTLTHRKLTDDLTEMYRNRGDVKFHVVRSHHLFAELAAAQVLRWIQEVVGEPPPPTGSVPVVAIGGGKTMADLVTLTPKALGESALADVRAWYARQPIAFINATAGGMANEPEHEASFLAVRLAQGVRQECGKDCPVRAMVHTNSLSLPPDEVEVLKSAEANTRVVVSGIGAEPNAYCIRTIHQRYQLADSATATRPNGRLPEFAGEILFHLFDQQGNKVTVPEIKVKKSNGRAEPEPECEMAMLTTLFDFSQLCGRGAEQRPKLIVVASFDEQTAAKKATALSILLAKGYITHACLAADLASELRSHAQGC